jgi:hypothetical protein
LITYFEQHNFFVTAWRINWPRLKGRLAVFRSWGKKLGREFGMRRGNVCFKNLNWNVIWVVLKMYCFFGSVRNLGSTTMLNFALPSRCNKKVKNFQNVVLQKTTKSRYLLNFENILNALNFKCEKTIWKWKTQNVVTNLSYIFKKTWLVTLNFFSDFFGTTSTLLNIAYSSSTSLFTYIAY